MVRRNNNAPRIVFGGDCGNSPKNTLLLEFAVAFAKRDTTFLLDNVADDVQWSIVNGDVIQGKERFAKTLARMANTEVSQLTIHHIVSHGKAGAVNGTTQYAYGKTSDFCDVYEFTAAKGVGVKAITSYVIERTGGR